MTKVGETKSVYTMPCKPGSVFVNFGDACLNDCRFCVKRFGTFFGYSLDRSFDAQTLFRIRTDLERIKNLGQKPKEVVMCGIGEPFLHYDELVDASKIVRSVFGSNVPIRADTAALWWQKRKDLSFLGFVDSLSVSLNAESEEKYCALCLPRVPSAFQTLMDFLGALKKEKEERGAKGRKFPKVRLTVVDTSQAEFMPPKKESDPNEPCPVPDFKKCQKIADYFGFPLVIKHLFRDVAEDCWNPNIIEQKTLGGNFIEKCANCEHRHV